jgi:hypothetical protein
VEQAQGAEANSVAGFVQYMGTNGYVSLCVLGLFANLTVTPLHDTLMKT